MVGRICSVAAALQRGSHLPRDNDGVSQMEHAVCVFVCEWLGAGPNESPMGHYLSLRPAANHNKHPAAP